MEGAPVSGDELGRRLLEEPHSFGFFQAVRLLQRAYPGRAGVGGFAHPREELVRFAAHTSIAFPASEIQALDANVDGDGPAAMTVNFMGLTGPQGVLPLHYTLLAAERASARDTAMRDFLDLFNHRLISLFYRAWEKNRFTVAYERALGNDDAAADDPVLRHARDLVGIGTEELHGRAGVDDETLVYYAGLLGMRSRSAVGLEELVSDYFDVPARVEQFVGAWYPIDVSTQCEVGDESSLSSALGVGAVVGDEVWDQQSRIRLRIGPLARERYDEFLPGGSAHAALRSLASFYCNDEMDVELQLVLEREEVPSCVLGAGDDEAEATPLGWCTWLRTGAMDRDPDETVLTL
jgi:type VI secretion system protein ImpH